MANGNRRRANREDDNYIFASSESLERQEALMNEMADRILEKLDRGYETISNKISANQEREYSKYEAAINEAYKNKAKQDEDKPTSWKESIATNILNQTGQGQQFDVNWRSIGKTIGSELVQGLSTAFSTYVTKPLREGFDEMSSTYEREFTAIAGRLGTDRDETHDTMKGAIDILMSSSAKNAVDINRELIPELRKVAEQGFLDEAAMNQAVTNAIDARIMPWLDTASDAWITLSMNLSKDSMEQIKGQQLLLQESQAGNRLLQSGVVNQLTSDIAPTLTNIDFNTGGASNLGPEALAHMEQLVAEGMSAQEAYATVTDNLRIWKDPAAALESGNAYDVIRGAAAYQGADYSGIVDSGLSMQSLAASTGMNAGFVMHGLGMNPANGIYRWESASQYMRGSSDVDWDKYADATAEQLYEATAAAVSEKSTATAAHDTYLRNVATEGAYTLNTWPHGPETLLNIYSTLGNILKAIAGGVIGNTVLNAVTGKLGGGFGKGVKGVVDGVKSLFSGGGGKVGSVVSNVATGGKGLVGAAKAGASALGKAGGLKAGGLIGGLAQGGSSMTRGALSGVGASAMGAATSLAGGAIALKGGQILGDTISNWDEPAKGTRSKAEENAVGIIAGGAAVLGGGAALAGGMGLLGAAASGPVGWAGLAIGGLALAGKKIYDTATYVGGASEAIEEEYEKQRQSVRDTGIQNSRSLADVYNQLQTTATTSSELEAQRNALIETGLLSEADAQKAKKMSTAELKNLTQEYAISTKKIANATDVALGKYENESSQWAKQSWEGIADVLQSYNDNDDGKSRNDADYIEAASGIMDTIYGDLKAKQDSGEELSKSDEKLFAAIEKAMEDGYTAKELNSINDSGWLNEHLKSASVSPEAMQQIIGMLQLQSDTGNTAAAEMLGVVEQVEKSGLEYRDASQDAAALDYLNELLYGTESQTTLENVKKQMDAFKKAGFELSDYEREKKLLQTKYKDFNFNSYRVGTPYIYHDQLAMLHEGEAVLTKEENKARMSGLIDISPQLALDPNSKDDNVARLARLLGIDQVAETTSPNTSVSSTEIVNAIKAQTSELKAAIQQLISYMPTATTTAAAATTFTRSTSSNRESLKQMMPTIANTRNLGLRT